MTAISCSSASDCLSSGAGVGGGDDSVGGGMGISLSMLAGGGWVAGSWHDIILASNALEDKCKISNSTVLLKTHKKMKLNLYMCKL